MENVTEHPALQIANPCLRWQGLERITIEDNFYRCKTKRDVYTCSPVIMRIR